LKIHISEVVEHFSFMPRFSPTGCRGAKRLDLAPDLSGKCRRSRGRQKLAYSRQKDRRMVALLRECGEPGANYQSMLGKALERGRRDSTVFVRLEAAWRQCD
jgi:hypothetical protein